MPNTTDADPGNPPPAMEKQVEYFPRDDATNFWMYAVIAAGSAFIIFVAVALYTVCQESRKDTLSMRGASSTATARRRSTLYSTTATNIDSGRLSVQIESQGVGGPS